jgi:hypothetical protein
MPDDKVVVAKDTVIPEGEPVVKKVGMMTVTTYALADEKTLIIKGGDVYKILPSSEWGKYTPTGHRPPVAFDMSEGDFKRLISPESFGNATAIGERVLAALNRAFWRAGIVTKDAAGQTDNSHQKTIVTGLSSPIEKIVSDTLSELRADFASKQESKS